METTWFYNRDGRPALYQTGDWIYESGKGLYHVSGRYWYEGGKAVFYADGKWIYSIDGTATYYRD